MALNAARWKEQQEKNKKLCTCPKISREDQFDSFEDKLMDNLAKARDNQVPPVSARTLLEQYNDPAVANPVLTADQEIFFETLRQTAGENITGEAMDLVNEDRGDDLEFWATFKILDKHWGTGDQEKEGETYAKLMGEDGKFDPSKGGQTIGQYLYKIGKLARRCPTKIAPAQRDRELQNTIIKGLPAEEFGPLLFNLRRNHGPAAVPMVWGGPQGLRELVKTTYKDAGGNSKHKKEEQTRVFIAERLDSLEELIRTREELGTVSASSSAIPPPTPLMITTPMTPPSPTIEYPPSSQIPQGQIFVAQQHPIPTSVVTTTQTGEDALPISKRQGKLILALLKGKGEKGWSQEKGKGAAALDMLNNQANQYQMQQMINQNQQNQQQQQQLIELQRQQLQVQQQTQQPIVPGNYGPLPTVQPPNVPVNYGPAPVGQGGQPPFGAGPKPPAAPYGNKGKGKQVDRTNTLCWNCKGYGHLQGACPLPNTGKGGAGGF